MGDHIEKLLDENPLMRFSLYVSIQAQIIVRKADELRAISSSWVGENGNYKTIHHANEYYGDFWLWILGSYEVIRTMDQHSECFQPAVRVEIRRLKKRLKQVRIPFAKLELENNKGPTYAELSVCGIGRGFLFEIEGQVIDSEDLMDAIKQFLQRLEPQNILKGIPERPQPSDLDTK